MVAYEEDGVFKVVPTLFPIDPNIQSTRADRWMDLGENLEEAKEVATNRDEVFTFSSMEEAQAFANGGYKSEDTVNLEMRKIYEEKGYDYDTESKKVDEYRLLRDALAVYEAATPYHGVFLQAGSSYGAEVTPEMEEAFPEMFVNGRWSQNAIEVYEQMNARRGALIDAVYDDPELETLRERKLTLLCTTDLLSRRMLLLVLRRNL